MQVAKKREQLTVEEAENLWSHSLLENNAFISVLREENTALKAANAQYLADLKITKDSITELLAKIGLLNEQGTFADKMDFVTLSKTILNVMRMSDEKKKAEFACIVNMIPVFEKYKTL